MSSDLPDVLVARSDGAFDPFLEIEISADPTIGYATIQNNIPVVRSISVRNKGMEALKDVDIAEPERRVEGALRLESNMSKFAVVNGLIHSRV